MRLASGFVPAAPGSGRGEAVSAGADGTTKRVVTGTGVPVTTTGDAAASAGWVGVAPAGCGLAVATVGVAGAGVSVAVGCGATVAVGGAGVGGAGVGVLPRAALVGTLAAVVGLGAGAARQPARTMPTSTSAATEGYIRCHTVTTVHLPRGRRCCVTRNDSITDGWATAFT